MRAHAQAAVSAQARAQTKAKNEMLSDETTTSFEVEYEGDKTYTYIGCGQCVGYYSQVSESVSMVLYEKGNQAYWTLTITPRENGKPYIEFYFVDRSSQIPANVRGTYYPVYDVSEYFDLQKLELKNGGIVAGKLYPVKIQSMGTKKNAVFSGSFEIKIR